MVGIVMDNRFSRDTDACVMSAWVTVAVADEKVRSHLTLKDRKYVQTSDPAIPASVPAEWPAEASPQQDVIFFESRMHVAKARPEMSNRATDADAGAIRDLVDFDTFEAAAPGWEDYRFKKMLALMQRMPEAVEKRALDVAAASARQSLSLHCVYTAIKEWVGQHRDVPAVEKSANDGDVDDEIMQMENDRVMVMDELIHAQSEQKSRLLYGKGQDETSQAAVTDARKKLGDIDERLKKAKDDREAALLRQVTDLLSDCEHGQKVLHGDKPQGTGNVREWVFAVKKLNYKMSIGLVSTGAALFHDWFHARHFNKAWFWQCCCVSACDPSAPISEGRSKVEASTGQHFEWHRKRDVRGAGRFASTPNSRGFLANGDQIHMHTQERFREGSHVVIKLDEHTGKVSFWLRDAARKDGGTLVGEMDGANGVVGEVYPAVCLHVNGDCVEYDPDLVAFREGVDKGTPSKELGGEQGSRHVVMQTEEDPDELARPYHYSHLSTVSQIERQLDEAEQVLRPYEHWPSMTASGWIGKAEQLPVQGLAVAKKVLAFARAILDGNASKALTQVKIVNLPADTEHQQIRDLFADKFGFSPQALSLKLDRDFLHPSDRVKLVPSMFNENMTAFVTLARKEQQTQALRMDKEFFRGRRLGVSSVARADAKELRHEGEKLITLAHRMLSLEHDLRHHVTRLQCDAALSLDAVFAYVEKRDGSQAKAALERARESTKRLPAGELLAFEQAHLEDEMLQLQQHMDKLARECRDKVEDERRRLEREMKARLEKFRGGLAARGERKDRIAEVLRSKRHEIEIENHEMIHQIQRETALKIDRLQQKFSSKSSQDLGKRMQDAEDALHKQYPWLNFHNVEDMLGRLDWLLDSAEYSLRRIDRGEQDFVAAYECVTSARSIIAMPIGFDDRRQLGFDTDKALNAVQLNSLQNHWHALLRAFPERGQLIRSYDLLLARLNTIERLLQSLMRPLRDRVFTLMQQSSNQLVSRVEQQHVIEAARALRDALQIQKSLPKELAPKDLAATVEQVNSSASQEIMRAHSAFWQQAMQAQESLSKPLKDIYLSFDCGPTGDQLKNAKDAFGEFFPFGGKDGRRQRSEVYFQQQTDARGWAVFHRVKRALENKGWTVHTSEDYPYEAVYQEIECSRPGEKPMDLHTNGVMSRKTGAHGVGDYPESVGVRLQLSGDHREGKELGKYELPVRLAMACKDRLRRVREKARTERSELDVGDRAENTGELSRLDGKVHVEASRFTVVSKPEYNSKTNTTVIDIAIHPTQTKVDRCSVESLASNVYLASEDGTLGSLLGASPDPDIKCHWPWPLPTRGTATTDYDIKTAQKIQQSWAVLMLVTKRFMKSCQDPQFLSGKNSKAVSEMRNAVWFKGPDRIVTLLVDDTGDLGVPFTWRGRMGDMLRDCASFGCSAHSDIDACMSTVDSHLKSKMAMSKDAPAEVQAVLPITAMKETLEPRVNNGDVDSKKPVAGGSLLTAGQELPSGFTEALRSLPASNAKAPAAPLGLKWEMIGTRKPTAGLEFTNVNLAKALRSKVEFTLQEWANFLSEEEGLSEEEEERGLINDLKRLSSDSFIRVDDSFFRPVVGSTQARVTKISAIQAPVATLSSAIKMADELPRAASVSRRSDIRPNAQKRELTKQLEDLDQRLNRLKPGGEDGLDEPLEREDVVYSGQEEEAAGEEGKGGGEENVEDGEGEESGEGGVGEGSGGEGGVGEDEVGQAEVGGQEGVGEDGREGGGGGIVAAEGGQGGDNEAVEGAEGEECQDSDRQGIASGAEVTVEDAGLGPGEEAVEGGEGAGNRLDEGAEA